MRSWLKSSGRAWRSVATVTHRPVRGLRRSWLTRAGGSGGRRTWLDARTSGEAIHAHVAGAVGFERGAVPRLPPVLQHEAGVVGHLVELGRRGVAHVARAEDVA